MHKTIATYITSLPFILFMFLSTSLNAQTEKTINDLDKINQTCLDSGVNMLGCSARYYMQMDSMLNIVYNNLRAKSNSAEKGVLKREQLIWLKKRDIYFKKQDQIFQENFKKEEWGTDMAMITYQEKAEFVKTRVVMLIRKLRNK